MTRSHYTTVLIGGLGGSGTRAIADAVANLGFYPGECLNASSDNLIFTRLFKLPQWLKSYPADHEIDSRISVFRSIMEAGITPAIADEFPDLKEFAKRQSSGFARLSSNHHGWMTKEPNSHIFADPLLRNLDTAHFIYVTRDAFDMAYSSNRQQLINWGWMFDIKVEDYTSPEEAQLAYWTATERRKAQLVQRWPGRMSTWSFEEFVANPEAHLTDLTRKLYISVPEYTIRSACAHVKKPEGMGRSKGHPLNFAPDLIDEAISLQR